MAVSRSSTIAAPLLLAVTALFHLRAPEPYMVRTSRSMFPKHSNIAKGTSRNGMSKSQLSLVYILLARLGLSFCATLPCCICLPRFKTAAQPPSELPTYCWVWCACISFMLCIRHFVQKAAITLVHRRLGSSSCSHCTSSFTFCSTLTWAR